MHAHAPVSHTSAACSVRASLFALDFPCIFPLLTLGECRQSEEEDCRGEHDCGGSDGGGEDAEDEGGGPFAFPQDEGGGGGKRSRGVSRG